MDVPSRMQYSSASCTTHDHTERFSLGYFLSKISLCITMRYCRMSKKDVKGLIRRMYESYLSEKEKVLGLQQYYRRGLQQQRNKVDSFIRYVMCPHQSPEKGKRLPLLLPRIMAHSYHSCFTDGNCRITGRLLSTTAPAKCTLLYLTLQYFAYT